MVSEYSSKANEGLLVRLSSDGVFYTLQGEGPMVGMPSLFVRFDTCNLRCKWGDTLCDAHYTSWHPGSRRIPVTELMKEVLDKMQAYRCNHVVITGGEPTVQAKAFGKLTATVAGLFGHTTVETNGTIFVPSMVDLVCISPKLRSSTPVGTQYEKMHEKNRWDPDVIREWMRTHEYYFKFVINTPEDVEEVLALLDQVEQRLPDPQHVVFMPQGITAKELWERGKWIAELCKDLGVRFTPRIQVDLWGNRPGT